MKINKVKLLVFLGSTLVVLYGVAAAFYGKVVAKDEAYKELAVFMEALAKINSDYVEVPDMTKVQEGAFRGLIDALDPYSAYLTKAQAQALEKRKASGGGTPGMVISKRADVLYVVSTVHGGPADTAGVRPGDYVIAVDGIGVEDKSILEVESMLGGVPGSTLKLTVFRGMRNKPVDIEITRQVPAEALVSGQLMEGGVGVLDVPSLSGEAVEQAQKKLRTLLSAGAQKLILDLRDCADGPPQAGAQVANFFIKSGIIYYSENNKGERVKVSEADPSLFVTAVPVVVLINGSTAGAAEIAAGALKDSKRATVLGEQSFGDGSVQTRLQLKSGSVLILTTAKHYTPSGKKIQEDESLRTTGIKPDVECPGDERRRDLMVESYYDDKDDDAKYRELREKIAKEQLEKALGVLANAAVKQAA